MLMLSLELQLGPGHAPLPPHLGGVLHGFVEGGVKNHAPHLLPVLRPNGPHEAAHFMILPPPMGEAVEPVLRFAVMLYGTVAKAWPVLIRALLEQQACGLHGRRVGIVQAWCAHPAGEAFALLEGGQLLDLHDRLPMSRDVQALIDLPQPANAHRVIHRLAFRSPVLLASRKAQRDKTRMASGLPWPSLGSVLDSIAERMRTLEPTLATALSLAPDWIAPEAARRIEPFTPAEKPAQQLVWNYTATPRRQEESLDSQAASRRTLPLPGIVGDLIYPATGIEHEHDLLYWGQWLGVGQKTTLGCGNYTLRYD